MIPKIIHYIWLGGNPTPKIFDKCLASWKKFCPDYEIKRWDESNLNIDCCKYCRQAYDAKKYAFASDVLRFQILKEYGGIYVDIDVEFLKPIDELLTFDMVSGFENKKSIAPGLFLAVEKDNKLISGLLEDYKSREFYITPGMKSQETVCEIFSNKLKTLGFEINNTTQEIEGIKIFSSEYFAPKSMSDGKTYKTKNTFSIHHYASTWVPLRIRVKTKILQLTKRILGKKLVDKIKSKRKKITKTHETDKPLKVLHILSSNRYSGAENVACQIIKALGDTCESAYCSPEGPIREAIEDRDIKFISLKKVNRKYIKEAIKEFNPNIVHAHDPRAICNVGRIKGNFKIIAHVHNNRPDFKVKSIKARLFNHVIKNKKIRKIFWVSESCLNDYVYKDKVIYKSLVLNNIINQQEIIKKAQDAEIKYQTDISFLGRIAYQKNPQRLINIIFKIKKQLPKIKVAVIGDGDLLEETKRLSHELNLDKNVIFYGFLNNGFGLLNNSKLFLMSSRFEGNPMCILEAQTLGLPIIAPQISELTTTVKDGVSGYLYNSDEECVKLVIELLKDNEKYKRLKESTFNFSKEYNNVENYKEKILEIYQKS